MTDEDALLRAVIADPDDDVPRLIYADWLDEHGQSERAEFIRVQVALHELREKRIAEGVPELRRRELRLLRRYGEMWSQPLRPVALGLTSFRRGFIEGIHCDAERFLRRCEELFALAPIRDLDIVNAHVCALQLSRCPCLSRALSLSFHHTWLNDRDVSHLANSSHLGRLNKLNLARNRITGAGAVSLARSSYLGSLDDLYLQGNHIPRDARAELKRRFGSRVHF